MVLIKYKKKFNDVIRPDSFRIDANDRKTGPKHAIKYYVSSGPVCFVLLLEQQPFKTVKLFTVYKVGSIIRYR